MLGDKELIQVLELSVERLATEFQHYESCYFWWESDLQARLFGLL